MKKAGAPQLVVLEVAEQAFDNWADSMDMDIDEKYMDAEDLSAFQKQKRRLLKAIQNGSLIFNDEDNAVYTPQHKKSKYIEPITFKEASGSTHYAMDSKKKNQDIAKTYAMMGDITGLPSKTFSKLVGLDIKICGAIFSLLMD
jgi:hypothetical protein